MFEDVVAQIQDKLETQSQTEEALKNAEWTLNWIKKSEQLFQGAPCKVESLDEAEFTKQEFQQYKAVLERTGKVTNWKIPDGGCYLYRIRYKNR